jgi:hypothetical protein
MNSIFEALLLASVLIIMVLFTFLEIYLRTFGVTDSIASHFGIAIRITYIRSGG